MNRFVKFEIPRRSLCCTLCQTKWTPHRDCYSLIFEESDRYWLRKDICDECWRQAENKSSLIEDKPDTYFLWRSKILPQPKKIKNPSNASEKIFELFHTALSGDHDQTQAEAFILALLLKRKKKLIERKEIKHSTGKSYILFEDAETQETYSVPKVGLDRLEVHKIQEQIKRKLNIVPEPVPVSVSDLIKKP